MLFNPENDEDEGYKEQNAWVIATFRNKNRHVCATYIKKNVLNYESYNYSQLVKKCQVMYNA